MVSQSLRSSDWLGDGGKNGFIARHHLRAMGMGTPQLSGKPLIGIANTASELNPCNLHLSLLAGAVKRGVLEAGGLPLEFPVMSLGEPFLRPTSMLYRNLMAMELEEQIRANPLDAVVLLTGCDKTTPAALMAAASADLPAILLTGGPMLNGHFRGRDVGSGTDIWRMSEALRAGEITPEDFTEFESALNRSAGHCMTMGTASTMASLTETLGMQLSGAAALPAVDSRRSALAEETGRRAVAIVEEDLRPSQILTRSAFENAVRANAALGGSTNAVVHLLAISGRAEAGLTLADIDRIGNEVPLLADVQPSGRYLMEEFAYAGGVPALLDQMRDALDLETLTVSGRSLGEELKSARRDDEQVIRSWTDPVLPAGSGTAVLRGSLAPDGAVLKVSAASPELLDHEGPALVFDRLEDYLAVVDDPGLDVTAETVLVVRGAGPRGYPGMPEVGNLPMPRRLLEAGLRDMVRISDARMSGTAYGTCVLHVAPESAAGGPLALVRTGDRIRLDAAGRRLDLLVDAEELQQRAAPVPTEPPVERGWTRLYVEHVMQADTGADLDFLRGRSGAPTGRTPF